MGRREVPLGVQEAGGLVVAAAGKLGLDAELVQGPAQERRPRGEPDQVDVAGRVQGDLVAGRREVVGRVARRELARGVEVRGGPLAGGADLRDERADLLRGREPALVGVDVHPQPDHPLVMRGLAERGVKLAQADRSAAAEAGEGVLRRQLGERPGQVDGKHHLLGQRGAAQTEGDQRRDQARQQDQQASDSEQQGSHSGHGDLHYRAIVPRIPVLAEVTEGGPGQPQPARRPGRLPGSGGAAMGHEHPRCPVPGLARDRGGPRRARAPQAAATADRDARPELRPGPRRPVRRREKSSCEIEPGHLISNIRCFPRSTTSDRFPADVG